MLSGAPACRRAAAAALVASERGNDVAPRAPLPVQHSSAPELSCSPQNGKMSRMQLSQEDSQGKLASPLTPPLVDSEATLCTGHTCQIPESPSAACTYHHN